MYSCHGCAMGRVTTISGCWKFVRTNRLVIFTVFGVIVGLTVGFIFRNEKANSTSTIVWLGMIGELYLRLLKLMIVPLIIASIISVTASMDPKSNGRISVVCLSYTMLTNFMPCIVGCLLCIAINPGLGVGKDGFHKQMKNQSMRTEDVFTDMLRNLFPDNLIKATFQQTQTKYVMEFVEKDACTHDVDNFSNLTMAVKRSHGRKYLGSIDSPNILGLVIICTIFGVACGKLKDRGQPFRQFFVSSCDIVLIALRWILWLTPLGVASLVVKTILIAEDIGEDFQKLGLYIITIMVGLIACSFVLMPVAYVIIRRANPFRFIVTIMQPIMIAFATASTPVTMPELLKCLEEKNGIDKRVSRFVVPFSVTLGRCGTSLYIAVSTIFIMQTVSGRQKFADIATICILTTFSSMAVPAIHSSSIMTVIMLLSALDIPAETVAMLYTVDWFIDRCRSVTNLILQAFGAVVTQKYCSRWLMDNQNKPRLTDIDQNSSPLISPTSITDRNIDVTIEINKGKSSEV